MSDKGGIEGWLRAAGEDEDDPWPDEPDEFDPHSLGPDPPEVLQPGEDAEQVDDETFEAFWKAVLLANVGLFAVSLGPMFAYFRGRTMLGAALVAVGVVALYRTYRIYSEFTGDDPDEENEP